MNTVKDDVTESQEIVEVSKKKKGKHTLGMAKKKAKIPSDIKAVETQVGFEQIETTVEPREEVSPIIPDVEDESWKSDVDISDILYRNNAEDPYLKACKLLNCIPVSYIITNLESSQIVMRNRGLGARGAQAFAQALDNNSTINRLDLSANQIEYGGIHLAQVLMTNTVITYLDLSDNLLGSAGSEIAKMIAANRTLKTIILKGNIFGDKEASLISDGFKSNPVLSVLDLSYNRIGDFGAIAMGPNIAFNEGLSHLNLGNNQITQKGISAIFNGLRENTNILVLDIQRNGVGENGLAIQACIAKNSNIKELNLSHCRLDDSSMTAITKGLDQNRIICVILGSLQSLDLSGNEFSSTTLMSLLKSISLSKISSLGIKQLKLPIEVIKRVGELCNERPDLKILIS